MSLAASRRLSGHDVADGESIWQRNYGQHRKGKCRGELVDVEGQ
jgi:hypothetical protein